MKLRFQFRLRALLGVVLLVATFLGGMRFGERREMGRRNREEQAKLDQELAERDREVEKLVAQFIEQEVKADAEKALRRFVLQLKPEESGGKRLEAPRVLEPKQATPKRGLIESTLNKVDLPRPLPNPLA
ncbi:MAG TPA: hypothetical protein VG125_08690 [Pirellulales bacterium]|jgi:hypothetical protein|nr:hypothetical protein [Pirellulales bacterium]